nr:unnamed protein product [Callosobruchus analis]
MLMTLVQLCQFPHAIS